MTTQLIPLFNGKICNEQPFSAMRVIFMRSYQ
ncbi:Uncharacterised protein [Enterobacter cloacae]|uniref:Uncharacterized protein n=1 Tax=Enterobacter cloacae TaxID=550 RepID=A0A377LZA2_ENTCL|nr:Uncharacterised protein [Enterobacter cloacae]